MESPASGATQCQSMKSFVLSTMGNTKALDTEVGRQKVDFLVECQLADEHTDAGVFAQVCIVEIECPGIGHDAQA